MVTVALQKEMTELKHLNSPHSWMVRMIWTRICRGFRDLPRQLSGKKDGWASKLSALLSGQALEVYFRSIGGSRIFDKVKTALMKRYDLTEDGLPSQI